jgi:hypothetical protein
MRARGAFLCALLLAAPAGAQRQANDANAAIAAVLAQEVTARGPENAAETCVSEGLAGAPLAPDGDDPMAPGGAVRIRPQWHALPAPAAARPVYTPPPPGERRQRRRARPEPVPPPAPLAADVAARLDAAWRQATATPAPMVANAGIAAASVPDPLRVQRPDDDCALLTLSAPAFAGDAAFIEVAYQCGSVCGNGSLYALERREGRWQIVGIADTWIR